MVVEQKVKISEFPEFSILYYYQNSTKTRKSWKDFFTSNFDSSFNFFQNCIF